MVLKEKLSPTFFYGFYEKKCIFAYLHVDIAIYLLLHTMFIVRQGKIVLKKYFFIEYLIDICYNE